MHVWPLCIIAVVVFGYVMLMKAMTKSGIPTLLNSLNQPTSHNTFIYLFERRTIVDMIFSGLMISYPETTTL